MTRFERTTASVALVLAAAVPLVFEDYFLRVAATALYFVVLASSWNLLVGYTGQLSLAHAAFAAIGAYTAGLLHRYTGLNPIAGVLAGGLMAMRWAISWAAYASGCGAPTSPS